MPKITLTFNNGIQPPAKLGTKAIKPAGEGLVSYAQNVEVQNDEYGNSILVPGPGLTTIANNSELTGVPFVRTSSLIPSAEYIWFAEGISGATNILRRVKNISSGSTPQIDAASSGGYPVTVTHSGHSGVIIDDIVYRVGSSFGNRIIIIGKDGTDVWLQRITSAGSVSLTAITTITSIADFEHKMLLASDNNIYITRAATNYNGNLIDKLGNDDPSYTYTANVLDIPLGLGVTELAEWNGRLVIASNSTGPYTFAQRKAHGEAKVYLWDFISPSFDDKPIQCPSRYISAMVVHPDGSLLVFGGLDEGKTTLYEFTGYGFRTLYSYIGDMPRNRHAIDFDSQGRILWQTVDGQVCRFNKTTGLFEHLDTMPTSGSAGGFLYRLQGGVGSEFVATSGSGSNYYMKTVSFGNFIGDGAGDDSVNTPMAISPLVALSAKSVIKSITPRIQKALASGERIDFRLYKNGSTTTYSTMGSLNFTNDGAIAEKTIRNIQYGTDNMGLAPVWKMADGSATAPGILSCDVEYNELST